MENYDILRGNDISINSLKLSSMNGQLDMTVVATLKADTLSITFTNVSSLCISDWSYPMCLECIEIIDNLFRGWMPEVRYHIYDVENNHMNFYCQNIIIG